MILGAHGRKGSRAEAPSRVAGKAQVCLNWATVYRERDEIDQPPTDGVEQPDKEESYLS